MPAVAPPSPVPAVRSHTTTALVLFDGAGLARLGLERAGYACVGVELDPVMHHLGQYVGSGCCVLGDARDYALSACDFDAVWASPPCQRRSTAIKDLTRRNGLSQPGYSDDLLDWCLTHISGKVDTWWVENVTQQGAAHGNNDWGSLYNAAQFMPDPIQCRNRIIAGCHPPPRTYRDYRRAYPSLGLCPAITATEYKASGASDRCRASRFYGRNLTLDECAYRQGFVVPDEWNRLCNGESTALGLSAAKWRQACYRAIGNGVPVYMAKAFGDAANG